MMLDTIKLHIYEEDKHIDTVQRETDTDPVNLLKSLEEFRQKVNEKFTQKIQDSSTLEDDNEDELSSSDEEISVNCGSPKKRKT